MNISKIEKELDSVSELAAGLFVWGHPLVVMHRTRVLHCSHGGKGIPRHRLPYRLGLLIYEGRSDVVEATWFPPSLIRI